MTTIALDAAGRRSAKRIAANAALKARGQTIAELTGNAAWRSTSDLPLPDLDQALRALGLDPDKVVADAEAAASAKDLPTQTAAHHLEIEADAADEYAAAVADSAAQAAIDSDNVAADRAMGDDSQDDPAKVAAVCAAEAEKALAPIWPLVSSSMVNPTTRDELLSNVSALVRSAKDAEKAAADAARVATLVRVAPAGHNPAMPVAAAPAAQLFGVKDARLAAKSLHVWGSPDAPAIDPGYVFEPDMLLDAVISVRNGEKLWLYGPKGAGKTSFATQFAARTGRPFARIAHNRHTEPADIVGGTWPDADKGHVWKDGALTAALRKPGCIILLDEPTISRPGTLALYQTLLDENYLTIGETGERVAIAPGVIIMAADNTNGTGDTSGLYADTQPQNRAFLDRFAASVFVDYLPADKEAAALVNRTGCPASVADKLVQFATATRRKIQSGELTDGVGFRRLVAIANRCKEGAPAARAAQLCLLNSAAPEDVATLAVMVASDLDTKGIDAAFNPAAKPNTYTDPRNAKAAADFA